MLCKTKSTTYCVTTTSGVNGEHYHSLHNRRVSLIVSCFFFIVRHLQFNIMQVLKLKIHHLLRVNKTHRCDITKTMLTINSIVILCKPNGIFTHFSIHSLSYRPISFISFGVMFFYWRRMFNDCRARAENCRPSIKLYLNAHFLCCKFTAELSAWNVEHNLLWFFF